MTWDDPAEYLARFRMVVSMRLFCTPLDFARFWVKPCYSP